MFNFFKMDKYCKTEGVSFIKIPLLIVVSGVVKFDEFFFLLS